VSDTPDFLSIGAFGKVPTQGDFLRVQCVSPAFAAFDHWLSEGMEAIRSAGVSLPPSPVSFLYRAAGVREVLLGTMAPSQDSVGRRFPLAVFGAMDAEAACSLFSVLPTACSRFLEMASQLASAPPSGAEVAQRLAGLPRPLPQEFSIASDMRWQTLRDARSEDLMNRLLPAPPPGRAAYAFRTFLAACEPLIGRESDRPGTTLDCPVSRDVDRLAWLELARRALAWQSAPPSLLWTSTPPLRLLVGLGPSSAQQLLFYAKPDHASSALWPVTTERPDAIAKAREALGGPQLAAIEGDLTLDALFASLTS
jgi:type VI secretion system protein ImpM